MLETAYFDSGNVAQKVQKWGGKPAWRKRVGGWVKLTEKGRVTRDAIYERALISLKKTADM